MRGIIFSAESIHALEGGRKTQTRRIKRTERCPFGKPGDVLYVKEIRPHWKSPRFMPERLARFHIRLTNVRVERLQEISNEDAWEEGCRAYPDPVESVVLADTPRDEFQTIWNALNARRGHSWENNPYVWVLEFELVDSL